MGLFCTKILHQKRLNGLSTLMRPEPALPKSAKSSNCAASHFSWSATLSILALAQASSFSPPGASKWPNGIA
jgi:hypothetical protein